MKLELIEPKSSHTVIVNACLDTCERICAAPTMIKELAKLLEYELRKRIPAIDVKEFPYGDGGIHLAGYVQIGTEEIPTFWHIHNGLSQSLPGKEIDPRIVNANNDVPFELIENKEGAEIDGRMVVDGKAEGIIRNGDIQDYVAVYELLYKTDSPFSNSVRSTGLTYPYTQTLDDRVRLLEFQIQTIAGLYRFSKEGGGIGGSITKITISPSGVITQA